MEKLVLIGLFVIWLGVLIEMGDCVNSKFLDNCVFVFILIEVLCVLKD